MLGACTETLESWGACQHHVGIYNPLTILVHLTFVIPASLLEDDEFDQLLKCMDNELMNAMIDWKSAPED